MVSSFVFKRPGADLVTTVTSVKGIHEITSHWVRSIAWSKESNATYSEAKRNITTKSEVKLNPKTKLILLMNLSNNLYIPPGMQHMHSGGGRYSREFWIGVCREGS